MSLRSQAEPASRGICSMKRRFQPLAIACRSNGIASSSLTPRISTALTFTGSSSAAFAASIPAMTSSKRSRKVNFLNRSRSRVSRLMFTRLSPAALRPGAISARRMPFVVKEIAGLSGSALMRLTISTMSGRSSGSPPVRRMPVMPFSVATSTTSMSSSTESKCSPGNQSAKSLGMQYVQRRLQRSVTETRKSR